MSEVWLGEHPPTGVRVAIKLLPMSLREGKTFHSAFHREVEAVARLVHPGVVTVFDYGTVSEEASVASAGALPAGTPYLVMELLDGGPLREHAPTSWPALRDVLLGLLDVLAYAHARGVIHRDVKLGNVLYGGPSSLRPGLRLIDFGIAAAARADRSISTVPFAGTPVCMAPEQVVGAVRDEGPWTDLYALGCVAYQLACRRRPFEGDRFAVYQAHLESPPPPLRNVLPVPAGFGAWIARLMQKRPRDRFAFAADAAHALRELGDVCGRPPVAIRAADTIPGDTGPTVRETSVATRPMEGAEPEKSAPLSTGEWAVGLRGSASQLPPVDVAPPMPRAVEDRGVGELQPALTGAGLGLWGLRSVPMVDREREREALWRALVDVFETKKPRAVVLKGAAGTGKSRLARWVAERAHEAGAAHVLSAVHGPLPGAADGITPMLARHFATVGLARDIAAERVTRRAAELGERSEEERAALADLVAPKPISESTSGRFAIDERLGVVRRFLGRLGSDRPVVLWIDDVQWGRPALELAAHVMRMRDDVPVPVLVVLTAREEALAESPSATEALDGLTRLDGVTALDVGPLSESAHEELVRRLLGLSGEVARRLATRTGGNPLFAVHLLGDWVRRGDLVAGADGFELRDGAELSLPDDLHAFWIGRVDDALAGRPAADRVALELTATLGGEVLLEEVRAVCARAGVHFGSELLDELARRRLVRRTPVGLAFAHGMIREAIVRAAAEAGRGADQHRTCAAYLAEHRLEPGASARVGGHLFAAGAYRDAIEPLLDGASEAWRTSELASAAALLDATEVALARSELPPSDPRRGELALMRARMEKAIGNYAGVRRVVEDLIEDARAHGWIAALPHALHLIGTVHQQDGILDAVTAVNEQALVLCEGRGDDLGCIDALWALGWVARHQGRLDEAERYYRDAREIADRIGDLRERSACWRGLAQVALRRGDLEGALECERHAIRGYEEVGDRMGLVFANNGVGEILRVCGEVDGAETAYRRAVALAETVGSTEAAVPRLNLGFVLLDRERWSEAEERFDEVARVFEAGGRKTMLLGAEVGRLVIAAARGDAAAFDAVRARFEPALDAVRLQDRDLGLMARAAGERWEAHGDLDRAAWCYGVAHAQLVGAGMDAAAKNVAASLARVTER